MPILTRAKLAQRLELSESRIQQLTADGVLKRLSGGYDLTASALALLKHQRSDHESRAMRVRYQQSQASATELRVHRQLKRLLHIDELSWLYGLFLNECYKAATAVAARIYAELSATLGDAKARPLAHLADGEFRQLIRAFQMTIDQTVALVRDEKLPEAERLALVARSLLPGNLGVVKTYQDKFTQEILDEHSKAQDDDQDEAAKAATTATTGEEGTDRPAARRRGRARGAASAPAVRAKR